MTETEFNQAVESIFMKVEAALEASGAEVDYETNAGILTLEFSDGSQIIVNRQTATQEIWVAARSGGFHYRFEQGGWRNTRDGSELFASLAACIGQQAGHPIVLDDSQP